MLYSIMAFDAPNSAEPRKAYHEPHLTYFKAQLDSVALSGPLFHDDGTSAGSLIIIDADNEAAARAFIENDPFYDAGVFGDIHIQRFDAKLLNQSLLNP